MKLTNKALVAALLLAPAMASAQTSSWTTNSTTTQGDSVIKVSSASLLTSATAETAAYIAADKSCITVDHLSLGAAPSRTITIKGSPTLTGGISTTAVAGVSVTGAGVHATIPGQARRVWVAAAYATGASGTTSATITEVTNCQR